MTRDELLSAYAAGKRDFRSVNLQGENLQGVNLQNANLRGANLRGADLGGVNLQDANLRGANLRGADLGYADLQGVNLQNVNLRGAYLGSAGLGEQWIIQGPIRSDGYQFFLMRLLGEKTAMVRAGCRWMSLPEARTYWQATRGGTQLGNETMDILIWLERAMALRGLS